MATQSSLFGDTSSLFVPPDDGHKWIWFYCLNCGRGAPVRLSCGDRLCPLCKQVSYNRLFRLYFPKVCAIPFHNLSFLTLTLKNTPCISYSLVRELFRNFSSLRNSSFWKTKVRGGIAIVEAKHISDIAGWNLHLHILIDSAFIPKQSLSNLWFHITKNSFIVDIRKVSDSKTALFYLLKYFQKTPLILGGDVIGLKYEFNKAFFRSRNVVSFGSLYASERIGQSENKAVCPFCGFDSYISEYSMNSLSYRLNVLGNKRARDS